jgi:hypothetical protein
MIISTEFENKHYGVQEAAGSNPVTRTMKSPEIARFQDFFVAFPVKCGAIIRNVATLLQQLYHIRNAVEAVAVETFAAELNCFLDSFRCKESFLLFRGACGVLSASSTWFLSMRSFARALSTIWNIIRGTWTSAARMLLSGFAEAIQTTGQHQRKCRCCPMNLYI